MGDTAARQFEITLGKILGRPPWPVGESGRKPKPDVKALLNSPSVAAQKLGVTIEQLMGFVRDGELRYVNVGRGSKRPRYAFTDDDIKELIEQRKTREVACPSTNPKSRRHISGTTSKSVVVGFTARRAQQIAAKRKK